MVKVTGSHNRITVGDSGDVQIGAGSDGRSTNRPMSGAWRWVNASWKLSRSSVLWWASSGVALSTRSEAERHQFTGSGASGVSRSPPVRTRPLTRSEPASKPTAPSRTLCCTHSAQRTRRIGASRPDPPARQDHQDNAIARSCRRAPQEPHAATEFRLGSPTS